MTKEDNLPKIQIQNLYINLNAEVVQQLNLNPKEVRNYFGEQIMEAITTAIRKDKNDKPKHYANRMRKTREVRQKSISVLSVLIKCNLS